MKELLKAAKALSDGNRLKALKLLEGRDLCVCELTAALGLAQSTVSKHLSLLEDAGLVERVKDGLYVNYRLARENGSPYAGPLLGLMAGWLNEDKDIRDLKASLVGIDRQVLCRRPS